MAENAAAVSSMIVAGEALVSLSLDKQEASGEFQRFSTVGNEKAHQSQEDILQHNASSG